MSIPSATNRPAEAMLKIRAARGVPTPPEQIDKLGEKIVDKLVTGIKTRNFDPKVFLDILHGQGKGAGFAAGVMNAVRNHPDIAKHAKALQVAYGIHPSSFATAEGTRRALAQTFEKCGDDKLFNAYLDNPGGTARKEDIASIGLQCSHNPAQAMADIKATYRARFAGDEAGYNRAIARFEAAHAKRHGAEENARLRAAMTPTDAQILHNASEGKFWRGNGEAALGVLMENVKDPQRLAREYGEFAGKLSGIWAGATDLQRLRLGLVGKLSSGALARADRLIDPSKTPAQRGVDYLRETLKGYVAGKGVSDETLVKSLRALGDGPQAVTTARGISKALRAELVAARDRAAGSKEKGAPLTHALLTRIIESRMMNGPKVTVAEMRAALEDAKGSRDKLLAVARRFGLLKQAERAEVEATLGRKGFRDYLAIAGSTTLRIADRGLTKRLADALSGKGNDIAGLLAGAAKPESQRTARPEDVLDAIGKLDLQERSRLPAIKGFNDFLSKLPFHEQQSIRAAIAIPRDFADKRALFATARRAGEVASNDPGTSAAMEDAARNLALRANELRRVDAGETPYKHERGKTELALAYLNLLGAVQLAAEDRVAAAEKASTWAGLAAGAMTGNGALSVLRIAMSAMTVGAVTVGTRRGILGNHYTGSAMLKDFASVGLKDAAILRALGLVGAGIRLQKGV